MEEDESPLPEEGDADAQIGEIGMLLATKEEISARGAARADAVGAKIEVYEDLNCQIL